MTPVPATPRVSVVVPTYRRPESLRRCLASLVRQRHAPAEICVGRRRTDADSAGVIDEFARSTDGRVRGVAVAADGNLTTSMNAALEATSGELVALTDDDAEAPPQWIDGLVAAFDDERIGGVGGRDWQPHERGDKAEVGVVRWWGKTVGNHHLGAGPRRDVDILKGVNCCFRGGLLRSVGFDPRLRGAGNVSHWELQLCLTLRRRGWRLVYDPAIALDHHIEQRMDGDDNARGGFEPRSFIDSVHNGALAMIEHLPGPNRTVYRAWRLLIGAGATPGLLQLPRLLLRGETPGRAWRRFRATRQGHRMADATLAAPRVADRPSPEGRAPSQPVEAAP